MLNDLLSIALLLIGLALLRFSWDMFCLLRGKHKTRFKANDVHYTIKELHDVGNPFVKWNGYSNW